MTKATNVVTLEGRMKGARQLGQGDCGYCGTPHRHTNESLLRLKIKAREPAGQSPLGLGDLGAVSSLFSTSGPFSPVPILILPTPNLPHKVLGYPVRSHSSPNRKVEPMNVSDRWLAPTAGCVDSGAGRELHWLCHFKTIRILCPSLSGQYLL